MALNGIIHQWFNKIKNYITVEIMTWVSKYISLIDKDLIT